MLGSRECGEGAEGRGASLPAAKNGAIGFATTLNISTFLGWCELGILCRYRHLGRGRVPMGAGNFFGRRDIASGLEGGIARLP